MIEEEKRISIDRCKKILNKGKRKYSEEEVKMIRDYLYVLGEMAYENFVRMKNKQTKTSK